MSKLICPKCKEEMDKFSQLGIEIDQCSGCSGVWLDNYEWGAITRSRGKDAVRLAVIKEAKSDLLCPRCGDGSKLEIGTHSEYSDFKIEYCPKCHGCFFDRGEFARLLAR